MTQLDPMALSFPLQKLPERAVFSVTGADSAAFLHNLITADVLTLSDSAAAYAALLTPQGKMLFDFFVLKTGEGFLVDHAASQSAALIQRLSIYSCGRRSPSRRAPISRLAFRATGSKGLPIAIRVRPRWGGAALRPRGLWRKGWGITRPGFPPALPIRTKIWVRASSSRMKPISINSAASISGKAATSDRKWSRAWNIVEPREAALFL
ncbi:MAG: hypothetical protein HC855_08735 [Rhizobiales bacterium]|nr:hypothetical protein [Hyphomicrobiales bacterium]